MNDQQRAAMQMALEALEGITKTLRGLYGGWGCGASDEAITALREALAQPQVSDYDREFWGDKPQGDFAAKIIAKALHYPECWDTAAYPTLDDAVIEAEAWDCHGCSVCKPQNHSGEATDMVQGDWVDLLAAFESVWLWMENQADGQSKGGHATFDLMMLREQRDIAHAAISKFKDKNTPPVVPQGEPVGWRDHVEDRIRTWKQRTMNRSGDCLSIDDFMGADSIDDLIDFVCDEWSDPVNTTAPPVVPQSEPVAVHQWRKRQKDAPWHDAPHEFAYARVDDFYEARTLYTTPPSVEAAIEATKEKAAKVCEGIAEAWPQPVVAKNCAAAIKDMK